jgi:hypothetical protein
VPGGRCVHLMLPGQCAICRDNRWVWMTGGGRAYHFKRDCEALDAGQQEVAERGGVPDLRRRVPIVTARFEGREPCKWCASDS